MSCGRCGRGHGFPMNDHGISRMGTLTAKSVMHR